MYRTGISEFYKKGVLRLIMLRLITITIDFTIELNRSVNNKFMSL